MSERDASGAPRDNDATAKATGAVPGGSRFANPTQSQCLHEGRLGQTSILRTNHKETRQ